MSYTQNSLWGEVTDIFWIIWQSVGGWVETTFVLQRETSMTFELDQCVTRGHFKKSLRSYKHIKANTTPYKPHISTKTFAAEAVILDLQKMVHRSDNVEIFVIDRYQSG